MKENVVPVRCVFKYVDVEAHIEEVEYDEAGNMIRIVNYSAHPDFEWYLSYGNKRYYANDVYYTGVECNVLGDIAKVYEDCGEFRNGQFESQYAQPMEIQHDWEYRFTGEL